MVGVHAQHNERRRKDAEAALVLAIIQARPGITGPEIYISYGRHPQRKYPFRGTETLVRTLELQGLIVRQPIEGKKALRWFPKT
jgi:hypothetical protein